MRNTILTRRFYTYERMLGKRVRGHPIWDIRTMDELRGLARGVWTTESLARPLPRVVAGSGMGPAPMVSFWQGDLQTGEHRIVLARHQRNAAVLLHELAHAIEWRGLAHGPAFAERCIYLLIRYGGLPVVQAINIALESRVL